MHTQLNGNWLQVGNMDDTRLFVPAISNASDTYVLNVPDNSSLIVGCRVYSNGSKALAIGRVTALPVSEVN